MDLGSAIGKHHGWGDNTMPGLKAMFLDEGPNENIRCRFICDWCKVESNVCSNARLFLEIEKTHPDVVVMDLDLYAKIDGIETSKRIRSQFDIPVIYI
jgi:CheY-like chemotaxis protein